MHSNYIDDSSSRPTSETYGSDVAKKRTSTTKKGPISKVDDIDRHVGYRLRSRRMMLGMSQSDLSEAVRVSVQQVQKYEKATNRISSGRLYAFAELLMVPVSFFFKGLKPETENKYESQEENDFLDHIFARDKREPFDANRNSSDKEVLSLVKSFAEIKDPNVRKKIVDLVKSLSEDN
ncbi:MAG: helix-turn-helix domain-containing protein [Rickettsiaceae bacterium]|nr:helix-turn-helix domain-containing protein [Rickettsiaceae bacterium]